MRPAETAEIEYNRRDDCIQYEVCLTDAARANQRIFTCDDCDSFERDPEYTVEPSIETCEVAYPATVYAPVTKKERKRMNEIMDEMKIPKLSRVPRYVK